MHRRPHIRLVFALLAIAFFATPVALRAVGVHANAFENRSLAEAPKLSQGWDVFQQATRFLTDRMPLREQAVRANAKLWDKAFDTTPRYGSRAKGHSLPFGGTPRIAGSAPGRPQPQADSALRGRDGWLYISDELTAMCTPPMPFAQAIRRWEQLVSLVRASGRRVVMVIPPDKGSIYPEHLPDDPSLTPCAQRGKRDFWRQVSRLPRDSGLVGLRGAVRARRITRCGMSSRRGSPTRTDRSPTISARFVATNSSGATCTPRPTDASAARTRAIAPTVVQWVSDSE